MSKPGPVVPELGAALLDVYDDAVPQVYGFLRPRCDSDQVAEDLTAEVFLAAVTAVRRGTVGELSTAWLVGVARHKLVDHWRRQARDDRKLQLAADQPAVPDDPWDAQLDAIRAHEVLAALDVHHRSALTLRYLDDLPVAEVADFLGRSLHATEALLTRARSAFRRAYEKGGGDDG